MSEIIPSDNVPGSREPLLFTPGPLTTSFTVKQAMLQDWGSRDSMFLRVVKEIREELLDIGGVSKEKGYECVIMQGSGTFAVESVITTAIPRSGAHLLVVVNGAYGERIVQMAKAIGIDHTVLRFSEQEVPSPQAVTEALEGNADISHVAVVHHETTAGNLNPIHDIGLAVKSLRPDVCFIVDSMSAFGAYEVDMAASNIDYLVSSANKCIEGVPGFSYALCRRDHLETCKGNSRSLSLDMYEQWAGLEKTGQFRYTPPTQSLLAFRQALREFRAEGGVEGRGKRYQENFRILREGMKELGFDLYLPKAIQSCIIGTFLYPDDPAFDFTEFYEHLQRRGLVIYPGKLTKAPCFRLGSIGRLFPRDIQAVLAAIREVLCQMGVKLPVTQMKA